jgi:hypothetical protein
MKKKTKQELLIKVQTAVIEVADAASALVLLLAELKSTPRAEKTTVSKVVEAAFLRLKNARAALSDVEKILKDDAG